jgi:hypothetical protein
VPVVGKDQVLNAGRGGPADEPTAAALWKRDHRTVN